MKQGKILRIGLLMVFSQLLLTAFVVQWLFAQYAGEKQALFTDLSRRFADSKMQVMDSLIVMNLVDPLLKDKAGFKIHMEIDDSLPAKKVIAHYTSEDTEVVMMKSGGWKSDSLHSRFEQRIVLNGDQGEKSKSGGRDFLTHGVKMFIKKVTSDAGDSLESTFATAGDSILFKSIVTKNFNRDGHRFQLAWKSVPDRDRKTAPAKDVYFESDLFPEPYGVSVENYSGYLFGKVVPQFTFAFILLALTGAAFFISFRSLKRQMQLNVLKNELIGNISHELKTPVSTVKVAMEALKDPQVKSDPGKVSEYLEMASMEMTRLEMLINNVLNVSVLEDDRNLVNLTRMNLKPLVEEVVNSLRIRAAQAQATITLDAKDPEARVDKLHLQGVLLNLLDNALKYNAGRPEIHLRMFSSGDTISITVQDNGPGIADEYLDKIFDKFFRVPAENRHNVKGYGLGLSYVSEVMKKHNGSVSVSNRPEGGCIFTLTLPVAK